jgi:hypothetical protein
MSTLYQDAAGTTPVTAVEQPVGLMLDKARGMMLGPELVSNGTFDSGIAGWEQKYNATTSYSLGSLKVMPAIIDTNGAFAGQAIPTAIGRSYKVTFDLVTANAATYIRVLNNINAPWAYTYGIAGAAVGNKSTLVFTATATVTYIAFGVSGSGSLTNAAAYDNISVRELYGYHATQSITASRPTLSARYNLLVSTGSNLVSEGQWVASNISGVLQADGSSLVSRITPTKSNANQAVSVPVGVTTTLSAKIKMGTVGNLYGIRVQGAYPNRADAVFNLASGTIAFCAGSAYTNVSATISQPDADGFFSVTLTSTAVNTPIKLVLHGPAVSAGDSWEGAGTLLLNGFIKEPQLVIGTTSGQYQRVNTATDYDTDERYFPKYLRFDGVDDYLNLPFMNLYNGGAASIICARDAVSQATDTYIISERSTTSASPKYLPSRQLANAGNMDTFITDDAGAVVLDTVGSPFSGVANAVIRSIVDSGNNLKLFKNGVLAANDNYTRSGTLTLISHNHWRVGFNTTIAHKFAIGIVCRNGITSK